MSGAGSKEGSKTGKQSSNNGNSGKQTNTQSINEPRKILQSKRDGKNTSDGRSHSPKSENIWSARTSQSSKQVIKTDSLNSTEEVAQKLATDLNLVDDKLEQTNQEERSHRRGGRFSGSGGYKSSPSQRGSRRGNSSHSRDGDKSYVPTHQRNQSHRETPPQNHQLEIRSQIQEQEPEEEEQPDRSTSPNNSSGGKSKVKLSLAEFISTVGGGEDNEDETPSRVLWVGNIGPEVSEDELTAEFTAYGKLESLRILHDRFCAFVNFEEEECAKKAKSGLNGTIVGSQYIVINYRKADSKPTPSNTSLAPVNSENSFILNTPSRALWIGNISDEVTEDDLYLEFSQFGEIESVRLLTHKTCAFVNFMTVEDATNALHTLQGRELGNMPIKINFGKPPKRAHDVYGQYIQSPYMPQPYYPYEQYPYPTAPYMPPHMPAYMPMESQYPMYLPSNLCDLCGANVKELAVVPCGHSFCCNECLPKFRANAPDKGSKCPYCGVGIEKFVQVSYGNAYAPYAAYAPMPGVQEYPQ